MGTPRAQIDLIGITGTTGIGRENGRSGRPRPRVSQRRHGPPKGFVQRPSSAARAAGPLHRLVRGIRPRDRRGRGERIRAGRRHQHAGASRLGKRARSPGTAPAGPQADRPNELHPRFIACAAGYGRPTRRRLSWHSSRSIRPFLNAAHTGCHSDGKSRQTGNHSSCKHSGVGCNANSCR